MRERERRREETSVDLTTGLVSRRIFSDEEMYRLELERVFGRCWLLLGHESMLPAVGDYITNYLGEDAVVVWRERAESIAAFRNWCPRCGNGPYTFHVGHATSIACCGEPLPPVPMVAVYGGLIFGCWDAAAAPLEEYLGELRWYFDNLLLAQDMGGLEALPGCQRSQSVGNWKIACDNFAGDHYHTSSTHASAIRAGIAGGEGREGPQGQYGYFEVALAPAHGLGGIYTDDSQYQRDLARAERMGREVVEYVEERHRCLEERLRACAAKPYGFSHGNCFPNFNLVSVSSALQARSFLLWHPRGPHASEVWQWWLVERAAPRAVKEVAARTAARSQAAAGLFGQDDYENFERIDENVRTPMARRLSFHYGMGLGYEGEWPGRESWHVDGLPGLVGPRYWETNQRRFYAYWAKLMDVE